LSTATSSTSPPNSDAAWLASAEARNSCCRKARSSAVRRLLRVVIVCSLPWDTQISRNARFLQEGSPSGRRLLVFVCRIIRRRGAIDPPKALGNIRAAGLERPSGRPRQQEVHARGRDHAL